MEGILNAAKNALGFNSKPSVPLAGSANIPPAAVNAPNKKAASSLVNNNKAKLAALKPAGVTMPNAPAAPTNAPTNSSANAPASANASANASVAAPAAGGTLSDFIGGARRRKNLRKKYKMPGRRAATRKNRKAGRSASRKARRSTTRKNRRASRKARK